MKICKSLTLFAAAASLSISATANAQLDPVIYDSSVFGINRNNAELRRFDFATNSHKNIGVIKNGNNISLTGIDGSAYIPGYSNIIAFWKDGQSQTRLVYVNTETAHASIVGSSLGPGTVTGAVATMNGNANVSGLMNINPNNSPSFEFHLTTDTGIPITRDDLKKSNITLPPSGALYSGGAYYIRVKPKGNGNQNGVVIDGQPLNLQNGKMYTFVGEMQVVLYNDHIHNNGKAMGHWWLQITSGKAFILQEGDMIAGGTTGASPWAVYAIQNMAQEESEPVEFNISNDKVIPTEPFALKVTVLGAAISNGGYYNMPVTTMIRVGNNNHTPFGSYSQPVNSNVNDGQNPRSYIFPQKFGANTNITIKGKSWAKKNANSSGNNNNHWQTHMELDGSTYDSPYIKVLRNGDAVPDLQGFQNQNSIEDFVKDYIDPATDTIKLGINEAIYLFELGMTDLSSPAADFQDLVVLVTLAENVEDFENEPAATGPKSRLIKVNHQTGGYAQLMALQNEYDGLASKDGITFWATRNNELYRLNIADQSETRVNYLSKTKILGLEFAGNTLMGFENHNDRLVPFNVFTGQVIAAPADINMYDLGSIIFMPKPSDPTGKPVAYD